MQTSSSININISPYPYKLLLFWNININICLNLLIQFILTNRTLKSFILDAFGNGIFDFLECFNNIGELHFMSEKTKLF